jgi:hypothetical protein
MAHTDAATTSHNAPSDAPSDRDDTIAATGAERPEIPALGSMERVLHGMGQFHVTRVVSGFAAQMRARTAKFLAVDGSESRKNLRG